MGRWRDGTLNRVRTMYQHEYDCSRVGPLSDRVLRGQSNNPTQVSKREHRRKEPSR